jgi:transposase
MPVNILNLPGLNVLDFKETATEYHVKAEPVAISRLCPQSGRSHDTIGHGKLPLFVRDLPTHGKSMMIHLDAPRLLCKLCNKTFTAVVSEVDGKRQMTERLVRWIAVQSHDNTFAAVAEQVGVDEKTVRNIFDEHAEKLRETHKRETPKWLGMDEIFLPRARAVVTNIEAKTLIDILPDRRKTTIISFLRSLEHPERITHVAMDMWRPYREAVQEVLPHAAIVVDKYHVARMGNEALERYRRSLKASLTPKVNLGLKHDRKLLLMRQRDLDERLHLLVSGWLRSFPLLGEAYRLKEAYYDIYGAETKDEALGRYLEWEKSIPAELAKAFKPIPVAWRTWRPFILNHFDDHRLTNAFTESFNAKIREVYRNGRGYSFEALRAKVLFSDVLQKRISIQEKVRVKKKRFEEVSMGRMAYFTTSGMDNHEYETKIQSRQGNLGTDLPTLLTMIGRGQF